MIKSRRVNIYVIHENIEACSFKYFGGNVRTHKAIFFFVCVPIMMVIMSIMIMLTDKYDDFHDNDKNNYDANNIKTIMIILVIIMIFLLLL